MTVTSDVLFISVASVVVFISEICIDDTSFSTRRFIGFIICVLYSLYENEVVRSYGLKYILSEFDALISLNHASALDGIFPTVREEFILRLISASNRFPRVDSMIFS